MMSCSATSPSAQDFPERGSPRKEEVAAPNAQLDRAGGCVATQRHRAPDGASLGERHAIHRFLQERGDGVWSGPRDNRVGGSPQSRGAPGDGGSDLTGLQQVMVVLGITDGERVVAGESKGAEHLAKPARLANPVRQDHEPGPVEMKRKRQLQLAHDGEDSLCVRGIRLDDAPACGAPDAGKLECPSQRKRCGGALYPRLPLR